MKNKIECLLAAVLVVLSVIFIVGVVGLILPRYWITAIALVYCIYLLYRILNPKKRYYFVTYLLPRGGRGRIFIVCDKFRVCDIEKDIANDNSEENVVIDYYKQISKEEYEYQTYTTIKSYESRNSRYALR